MKVRQARKIIFKLASPIKENRKLYFTIPPSVLFSQITEHGNPSERKALKIFTRKI